tara:strand:+ start:730 stop:885 length:156 start_codon:yes stop_codon:yes gene_type:complete
MIIYIILTIMSIFTIWNIIYTHNVKKERNKIINNLNKLDSKYGTTNKKGKG